MTEYPNFDETEVPPPLQAFLASILDAAGDGITAQDKSGKLIYANSTAADIIGYPSAIALLKAPLSEVVSKFEIFGEDNQPFPMSSLPGRLALEGKESPPLILKFHNKETGQERWSIVEATPVYDQKGAIEFVVNTFREITELKNAELALRAEEAERRVLEVKQNFLADASAILVSSLDYETTLKNIAEMMTPIIADWSSVDIFTEEGDLQRVSVSHVDPEKVKWAYELYKLYPPNLDDESGMAKVLRTGKSEYYPDIPEEMLVAAARDEEHLKVMRIIGFRSAMVVAITAHNKIYGVLTIVTTSDSGRLLSKYDLLMAEDLGRVAGLAIENALSYRRMELERERFRVTLTSIGDAVIATDIDGKVNFLNGVAESLTGWPMVEALGRPLTEVFHIVNEQSLQVVENPVQKVLETGLIVGLANHTLLISRDGRQIPIEDSAAPIRYLEEDVSGVVLVFRDATEERRAKDALETARNQAEYAAERLSHLQALTSVLSGAATVRQIAQICIRESLLSLDANAGAIALFGKESDLLEVLEAKAKTPANKTVAKVTISTSMPLIDSAKTGHPLWLNAENLQKLYPGLFMGKAQKLDSQAYASLPLIIEERVIGSIGFSFDSPQNFTEDERNFMLAIAHQCSQALERARLYEAEMAAREEAEKANQLKMQFLAMISHELRNPLSAIRTHTNSLRNRIALSADSDPEEFLSALDKETDKLTNLAEQLLDLSLLQAGTLRISPDFQSVEDILGLAKDDLEKICQKHHLVIYTPKKLPKVWVDTERIKQILINLVSNAVKFSATDTYITIVASQTDGHVQIDVSDEGVGIPRHERHRIFEAFRQTGGQSPGEKQGAGLGLAISKAIIEAHGGTIWIQDKMVGTTISFTLRHN